MSKFSLFIYNIIPASTNMDTKRNENERGKTGPKRGEEIRNEINRLRRRMVDVSCSIKVFKMKIGVCFSYTCMYNKQSVSIKSNNST